MINAKMYGRNMISLIFSLLLLIFTVYGIVAFPAYQIVLTASIVAYLLALTRFPFLWLYVLLFITIAVNLAPWTGRYIVDELDFFVAVTGIYFLLINKTRHKNTRHFYIAIGVVALCLLTSFDSSWINAFGPTYSNFYVSPLNGLVIFKGLLWALLLSWVFYQQKADEPEKALKHLLLAAMLGGFVMFVVIMWEKQVLDTLFSSADIYTKVNTFFNLSSAYRTTGIISGMHTGGESIDGMYLFLLPLTLGACFLLKQPVYRFAAIASVVAVMYGVLMGFTRATYAASFIAMAVLSGMFFINLFKRQLNNKSTSAATAAFPWGRAVALTVAYSLLFYSVYRLHGYSGYFAELSAAVVYAVSVLCRVSRTPLLGLRAVALVVAFISFAYINVDSLQNSQWVDANNVAMQEVYLAICGALTAFVLLFLARKPTENKPDFVRLSIETLIVLLLSVLIAAAFSGARITIRAETTDRDLDMRLSHWQGIVDSGRWSTSDILFGHGLGAMPTDYALSGAGKLDKIGTFAVDNQNQSLVIIPGSDLMLSQRLRLDNGGAYLFEITYQAEEDVRVAVALCRRNMIIFEFWAGGCGNTVRQNLPASPQGESRSYLMGLTATPDSVFSLPAALTLKATVGKVPLIVESVSLVDASGNELLNNPSFETGSDFWFFYYDFEHLVWHVKNIYLSFAYQFGVVGTLLIVALILTGFIAFYQSKQLFSLPAAIFSAFLAGQFAFGLFGDPTDSARTSMWFYFMLFGALTPLVTTSKPDA